MINNYNGLVELAIALLSNGDNEESIRNFLLKGETMKDFSFNKFMDNGLAKKVEINHYNDNDKYQIEYAKNGKRLAFKITEKNVNNFIEKFGDEVKILMNEVYTK